MFQILSNITELKFDNPQYLRMMAYLLEVKGYNELALHTYKKILKLRPEEPQSLYNVAILQAKLGGYNEAIENLNKIVEGNWNPIFSQIEIQALISLSNIVFNIDPLKLASLNTPDIINLLLVNPLRVDLRILLEWDTRDSDLELHVEEPNGEFCYPFHNLTGNGGILSRDFTAGYGPVEYMIKKAVTGTYKIYIRLKTLSNFKLPITAKITIFINYGKMSEEKEYLKVVQLPCFALRKRVLIGTVLFQ